MKKLFTALLSICLIIMMSFTSFADSLDEKGAIAAAVKDAGLSMNKISRLEAEKDGGIYEIEFVRTDNGTEYDYEISAASGKILEKTIDYRYERSKSKKKIGKKAARKKASAVSGVSYKKIKKGSCKYKYKKKQGKYTVKFKSGGYRYEVEILAPTGQIIEYEQEMIRKK